MRWWPALVLAGACSTDEAPSATQTRSRYSFQDVTDEAGLAGFRQVSGGADKPFIVETIGGGVALFDVEGDGDLDAYLTNGARFEASDAPPRDALYLNDGSGHFVEGTDAAGLGDTGWTNGVRIADFDADGHPDVYLTNYGPNVLYRNRGDGTFEDVTERAGVGDPAWSTGACFLDFDRDGDLDLYVANYVDFDEERMLAERPRVEYRGVSVMKGPRGLPEAFDTFYVNEGGGVFRDASQELGIREEKEYGFQCVAYDFDDDGWVDVFVANDSVANLLWRNDGGTGFTNTASLSGLAFSMSGKPQAGMGVALGDYDGDLVLDCYVTNFADDYFTLYRGLTGGHFMDVTARMRLVDSTKSSLGWGCGFEDFDSDGDLEIFVANGHVYPQVDEFDLGTTYLQRNALFELDGATYAAPAGGAGPGFEVLAGSRGAAVGDVDGDGDLDLLFGNLDDAPTLLRNDSANGNWIKVLALGAGGNREAVGARIVVRAGEHRQLRAVGTAGSFLSTSDARAHVGLGSAESADEVRVTWASGEESVVRDVPAGSLVRIEEAGDVRVEPYGRR